MPIPSRGFCQCQSRATQSGLVQRRDLRGDQVRSSSPSLMLHGVEDALALNSIGAIIGLTLVSNITETTCCTLNLDYQYAVFPDKPVLFMAVLWILPYRECVKCTCISALLIRSFAPVISSSILFALNARQGLRAKSRIIDSAELDGRFLSYNTALSSIVVADVPTYTLDSYQ